ncbi:MAG: DUF3108 domain-containing protein [Thermoanaerobaculia bacterium]
MTRVRAKAILLAMAFVAVTGAAESESIECGANRRMEVVSYKWELNGFLSWFAGLRFPTHGNGSLATVVRANGSIETELRIISHKGANDLYQYHSQIDPKTLLTLASLDGYKFEGRRRTMTTTFDYAAKTMRREKEDTKQGVAGKTKVEPMPAGDIRDVLSVIHYLRRSATRLDKPVTTKVYSAGKLYDVVLTPGSESTVSFGGKKVRAREYTISASAAQRKKWPGDVLFWLTPDANAIPVRILIRQRGASLDLTAESVYTCP